jgi:hypothetical protein
VNADRPDANSEDRITGLPGLRSWTSVYFFVIIVFIFWVALLEALTRAFP